MEQWAEEIRPMEYYMVYGHTMPYTQKMPIITLLQYLTLRIDQTSHILQPVTPYSSLASVLFI